MLTRLDAEFAAAMLATGLDQRHSFVSALSGGADSTALCLLMARYAAANAKTHRAIIVDHGIRANASDEAARVATCMQARGIDVKIEKEIGRASCRERV